MSFTKKELIDLAESADETNKWIKEFCLSNISDADKIDVLKTSQITLKNYNGEYEVFANLINSKKHIPALKLSKLLAQSFPESKEDIRKIIKNKELNFVFDDLLIEPGGTSIAVVTRANNLVKRGYRINLLSFNDIQDYDEIRSFYYNTLNISKDINFINMYEYFSNKNTFTSHSKKESIDSEKFIVQETRNPDTSITYDYYDKKDSSLKIKSELFVKGVPVLRTTYKPLKHEYFTPDGFNYLTEIKKGRLRKFYLNDRKSLTTIKFETFDHLLCHFLEEFCKIADDKPFIVFDKIFGSYSIEHVDSDESLKIASIHGNPYFRWDKPEIGPNRSVNKYITHFRTIDDYRAFVVLTDSAKDDLLKDTDYKKYVTIPNLISEDKFEYEPVEKDLRKISLFARVSVSKNISDSIKAFKIVAEKYDDAVLDIYGRETPSERKRLDNLIRELDIEGKVIFHSFVSNVDFEMRKSLCTVLTSFYEGLPMVVLESMANSTPLVSYDINYGPRDIITNNVDGLIVDYGDYEALANNIIDLMDNPKKAIDMGLKGKEKIKNNYSADIVCEKWEDLFIDVYVKSKIDDFERLFIEENKNKQLKKENSALKRKFKKFKKEVFNSRSWKITRPLRSMTNILRKLFSKK